MDDNCKFDVSLLFGTVEIVQTTGTNEAGDILMGGYAIHRDRFGNEIRRTPNEWNCRLYMDKPAICQPSMWGKLARYWSGRLFR